eukprot:2565566-Lingulodinium_polyedra.AAC.1
MAAEQVPPGDAAEGVPATPGGAQEPTSQQAASSTTQPQQAASSTTPLAQLAEEPPPQQPDETELEELEGEAVAEQEARRPS